MATPPDFVTADGVGFELGGEPYTFVGANFYGAASDLAVFYCGGLSGDPDDDLDDMLGDPVADGAIDVLRVWAFQSYTLGGTDFSALDRVIEYAQKYDIRLVLVLENQWAACSYGPGSSGDYKSNDWYAGGYLQQYSGYSLSYREYVNLVVSRYRDEPTILMWQLMNEAESSESESLLSFAEDMSAYVKSLDPNHLLSFGTIGGGQPGTSGPHYSRLHEVDSIDVLEAHDYGAPTEPMPGYPDSTYNTVWSDINDARALDKPFFIGEAGILAGGAACYTPEERASLFAKKLSAAFSNGVSGYLIWNYWSAPTADCTYEFTLGDPLIAELARY